MNKVLQIAGRHFSVEGKRAKVRPQLGEATTNLIAFKRQVLQMVRNAEGQEMEELKTELKEIEKQLRSMISKDQRAWYDAWLVEIDAAGQRHDAGMVYKMLQRLGRRKRGRPEGPRPLPLLRDADGQPATSYLRMQEIWCEQFARNEAGIAIQEQDLIDYHLDGPLLDQDKVDSDLVPSVQQVVALIRRLKNGRVPGPNQLLAEVLKAGGESLAIQLMPILVKAVLWGREPLEWKSGCLIPLYKGSGAPQQPEAYRSIYISDTTAKIHHKWIRRTLEKAWLEDPRSLQVGGKKGMGTDIAHHVVQAIAAWTKQQGCTLGMLFLDLRAAFYSVYRGAMFQGATDDRMLVLAMESFNITPEDWQTIRRGLEQDHALRGVTEHAEHLVGDMFHGAHFKMGAKGSPVLSTKGTRPGDPVGDILFNMVFEIIMTKARDCFCAQTNFEWIGSPKAIDSFDQIPDLPEKALLDMAYVDDAMFAIYTTDPEEMVKKAQLMASIVHDEARKRGLDVNYQKGKTELWLRLTGKGSRKVKDQLWNNLGGKLPVITETGANWMHATRSYKHLGSYIQENVTPVKEIRQRISAARRAEGTLHRCFFAKKHVSRGTKQKVFAAVVMSKHMFQTHVWSWVNEAHLARWEDGMRDVVSVLARGLLQGMPPFKLSTRSLFAMVDLLPPSDQLHVARLRYCQRIAGKAPQVLWQLLFQTYGDESWLGLLQTSVAWLRKFGPPSCHHLTTARQDMFTYLMLDENLGRKVSQARNSCLQYRKQHALAQIRQYAVAQTLGKYGVQVQDEAVAIGKWKCLFCEAEFLTRRGLAMHSVTAHGYRKKAKYWMTGTQCHSCCREYHTRTRAVIHLQSNERCFATYIACFPPITDQQARDLDEEDLEVTRQLKHDGWQPSKALFPVMKIFGPGLPSHGSEAARDMKQKKEDVATMKTVDSIRWLDVGLRMTTLQTLMHRLRKGLRSYHLLAILLEVKKKDTWAYSRWGA